MKLGLIGMPLGHSWSPEIHKYLTGADYSLWEIEEKDLDEFFARRDFDGINVTIPYKARVKEYLDEIDEAAERMNAVNCITNNDGILKGYNTDYMGLVRMMQSRNVQDICESAAILGTGGAAAAATEACRMLGIEFAMVSRSSKEGSISYDELYASDNIDLIINATPVGMMPNEDEAPIDISRLKNVRYVIDIVANPLRTRLCFEAGLMGIPSCGGLEMLVRQALSAEEIFLGRELDSGLADECMQRLLSERRNVVLIGMPSSGKSTVGAELAAALGREFWDSDSVITERIGMQISDFFREFGEKEFRKIESEVLKELAGLQGVVIATGGGAVESEENMRNLAYNGVLVWVDRPLELLTPTDSRPLTADRERLERMYVRRQDLYAAYADVRISNAGDIASAVDEIKEGIR